MSEDPRIECAKCGAKCGRRVVSSFVHSAPDQSWEYENEGRGKWISGLGKRGDPKAYHRSLGSAVEAAKRNDKSYELG